MGRPITIKDPTFGGKLGKTEGFPGFPIIRVLFKRTSFPIKVGFPKEALF